MSETTTYRLLITEDAKSDLKKLDKAVAERILKKMIWVAENAEALEHDALVGEWSGLCRWRIGDWQVIYAIDRETREIIVDVIGHRHDIYDK